MKKSLFTKIPAGRLLLPTLLSLPLSIAGIASAQEESSEEAAAETVTEATVETAAEEPGTLDTTVVTSQPEPAATPPRPPKPTQTVRQPTATRPVEIEVYDTIEPQVFTGGPESTAELPGAGYFVTTQDIRDQNYVNVNRVLARVPGVYVREEDGNGLFPNISIRGADGTRSEKLTLMEDGILAPPATYSAPSAYYSPNVGRMAGVEILKGASQVRFGPHTTGGVVNYLSTPIPEHEQFYLRSTIGSDVTAQTHIHYGNTIEGPQGGRFGYLVELYQKRSDGFRTVDPGLGIPGSDETGYAVFEPMIKLSWEPPTAIEQRFEFKYGFTDVDADETYLGLTETDFRANPYRRYAGSFLDNIQTNHHRTYLKHRIDFNDDFGFEYAGYYQYFERDWFKIRGVNGSSLHSTLAPNQLVVFRNPGARLSFPPFPPNNLRVLQGLAPGTLNYRHNSRSYDSYGIQAAADVHFDLLGFEHDTVIGARAHKDNIRRFQENTDVFIGGASPVITNYGPGSGGNRLQESEAAAIWIQDDIHVGDRLTISPGVRHERVDLHNTDFASDSTNTPTAIRDGDIEWWVAGVGADFELDEHHSVFGGIHEGVAMPGPRSVLNTPRTDLEESTTYELGLRHRSSNFNAEVVGFLSDYDNLISTAAGLGLGGLAVNNAGAAEVSGVEALVSYDPNQGNAIHTPLFLSLTWTDTQLEQVLTGGGGEDIYGDGAGGPGIPGAELPYIPEWKLTAGAGLEAERWGLDLTASYVSDTFGTALNAPFPVTSARQGEIDGGIIFDLGGYYQINDSTKFLFGVHNLFDEVMITSRIPEGPRANAPRQVYVGLEILWDRGPGLPSAKNSLK